MNDYIDDASAALVIQLQIQDSQNISAAYGVKGKGREGELSDWQLAISLYEEDLRRGASLIGDRQMTRSIARACQVDGDFLTTALSQEQTAAADREMACNIGGVENINPMPRWTISSEEMDEELLAKLSAIYVEVPNKELDNELMQRSTVSDDENNQPESSTWAAKRGSTRRCEACQERSPFFDTARAPCGHEYCRECLQELFRASMTDDSLFPPRCCRQPITTGSIRIFLNVQLLEQYEQEKIEFNTSDRTYCSNPLCSVFIRPVDITNEQALCIECDTVTCTLCKATSHTGDCPADTALQQVLQTAIENGWQRCYSCRRLVELDIGCNHITCHCGAQFCYVCAERWKTCTCAQWDEERLVSRANQVVARQPARPGADPITRDRIGAVVQNLRNRHNCDHNSWQYVRGQHRCEECYHTLPSYIFECRQCHIQACNRCRRNRL